MDAAEFVRESLRSYREAHADDPAVAGFDAAMASLREAADEFARCPHCGRLRGE